MIFQTVADLLKEKKFAKLISVAPTATVTEAVRTMNDVQVGAAVVLDRESLVGIITERDVMVRVVGRGRQPEGTAVSDVMTRAVSTVTPKTSISDAMSLMSQRRYRHLPVVDNGRVCGVISMGDATQWVIREQAEQVDMAIGAVKQMGFSNRRG
jgi:CBS domain-containing protein